MRRHFPFTNVPFTYAFFALTAMLAWSIPDSQAHGQLVGPAYVPAQPVVTYSPERRGLFGQRVVYRPQIQYAVPTISVPTVSIMSAPITTYYAPATTVWPTGTPVTTGYAPLAAPTTIVPSVRYAPTTTYYAPHPPAAVIVP